MKAKNVYILKGQGKKRGHDEIESDDSSQSEGEIVDVRPKKTPNHKYVEPEIEIEDGLDEQIDGLLHTDDKTSSAQIDVVDSGLKEIEEEYEEEEKTGPPISKKLAGIMAKTKMGEDKIKEKMDKHKRPENCHVIVAKVNPEIWGLMDHTAKAVDLRIQRAQKRLVKASFTLAKVSDALVKNPSNESKSQLRDITDAMALVLKTSHDLSVDGSRL